MLEVGNFTVEEYNDGYSIGFAIHKDGALIAMIDEPIDSEELNIYVFDDKDNEEWSHKIELKNY